LQEKIWGEVVKIKNSLSKPRKLALCGFMGAGKTSVYSSLSGVEEFKSFEFIDIDEAILEANPSHSNISEFVAQAGWKRFREAEQKFIKETIGRSENLILSLGGGCLNARLLEQFERNNVKLVWLKVDFEELMRRASSSVNNRPLLKEKSEAEILSLYQEREKLYSKADIIIDNKSLEVTVRSINDYLLSM